MYQLSNIDSKDVKLLVEGLVYRAIHIARTANASLTLDEAEAIVLHPLRDAGEITGLRGIIETIYNRVVEDIGE